MKGAVKFVDEKQGEVVAGGQHSRAEEAGEETYRNQEQQLGMSNKTRQEQLRFRIRSSRGHLMVEDSTIRFRFRPHTKYSSWEL